MLVHVKNRENDSYEDLNLFRCGCGHPIEERNIRFKVSHMAMVDGFMRGSGEIIVQGTICRFCPYCYTMNETPCQELHLNINDLSDLATGMIIEKEKRQ